MWASVQCFAVVVFVCLAVTLNGESVPEIRSLHIRSDITYRFATTNVSSQLANVEDAARQVTFLVTLPKAAFISYFEMIIDGEVYPGSVKEKEVAKKQYEKAKKKGQSAGHVSRARDTGTFKVSVNVAARSKVYFNLTYQELLQRRLGMYRHVITINPGQVVRDLRVDVFVIESREIQVLKVPSIKTDYINSLQETTENPHANIRRISESSAHVSYRPTIAQQKEASESGIAGQFIVEYDIQRDLDAGEIQVVDGYFVHYFAPSGLPAVDKNVLFVLDTSGSMSGTKMQQLKEAMYVIIDDLRNNDKFFIVTFSSTVSFGMRNTDSPGSMFPANPMNKQKAIDMISDVGAGGGTNINDALMQGIEYLEAEEEKEPLGSTRSSMVIFLTDGEPTSGITDNNAILRNIFGANEGRYALYSLGFGNNVEFPFLQKLSLQNKGIARKIYEDSDAALQLQGFYSEVATPTMNDIKVTYIGDSIDPESITEADFPNYFDGSEIIVAGKLRDNTINTIATQVSGHAAEGYMELDMDVNVQRSENQLRRADVKGFTERLWAYLTIKKLLDKLITLTNETMKSEAKAKALELSLKYSFVTPLTSMVVTKPDEPEEEESDSDSDSLPDSTQAVQKPVPVARNPQGHQRKHPGGGGGRSFVDNDPHFLVKVEGIQENLCFDVDGEQGDIYQLIFDRKTGTVVNGKVVMAKKPQPGKAKIRSYFGQISVHFFHPKNRTRKVFILIAPHSIHINGQPFSWKTSQYFEINEFRISILKKEKVLIETPDDIVFSVLRHLTKHEVEHKIDFLGLYIKNMRGFSKSTHGLIGQFLHEKATLVESFEQPKETQSRLGAIATIHLKRKKRYVEARLGRRENMELKSHMKCWFVRNNGHGLLDGKHTDYLVPKLNYAKGIYYMKRSQK